MDATPPTPSPAPLLGNAWSGRIVIVHEPSKFQIVLGIVALALLACLYLRSRSAGA